MTLGAARAADALLELLRGWPGRLAAMVPCGWVLRGLVARCGADSP